MQSGFQEIAKGFMNPEVMASAYLAQYFGKYCVSHKGNR